MLTGVVKVSIKGNNVTLIGDNASNHVQLRENSERLWLIGSDGTTFSGDALDPSKGTVNNSANFVSLISTNNVGNIKINMKGGDDTVQINRAMRINGKTNLITGQGDDIVEFDGSQGSLSEGDSNGTTSIKTGSGDDLVELVSDWRFDGSIKVATGSGDDLLVVADAGDITFNGKINDNLGSGNDTVYVEYANVWGSPDALTINGGSGIDALYTDVGWDQADWDLAGNVKGLELFG